ncbi:MAG: hypothetical protein PUA74_00385, partial [Clostridiales bacterium]|nr:hypothetical protein [Clostridiales bacterium]
MANEKKNKKTTAVQKSTRRTDPKPVRDDERSAKTRRAVQKTDKREAPEPRHVDPVPESSLFRNQLLPFVFVLAALLLTAFLLLSNIEGAGGSGGGIIRDLLCGLLG